MNVVVVYESVFHNTHSVADAVTAGISAADPSMHVTCLSVSEVSSEAVAAADLLVVGGPTHMRGMTTGLSRKMGLKQQALAASEHAGDVGKIEPGTAGRGLRDWFHDLPNVPSGRSAAVFDTRTDTRLAGAAGHGIARRLRHRGYCVIAEPEGFIVEDIAGPLRDGELERAAGWGASLVTPTLELQPGSAVDLDV